MRKSGFKMKSAASGGPMRRNFPSVFKKDEGSVQDNTRTPSVRTDIEIDNENPGGSISIEGMNAEKAAKKAAKVEANKKARKQRHTMNVVNYDKEMNKMRPNATKAQAIYKEINAYRKEFPGSI